MHQKKLDDFFNLHPKRNPPAVLQNISYLPPSETSSKQSEDYQNFEDIFDNSTPILPDSPEINYLEPDPPFESLHSIPSSNLPTEKQQNYPKAQNNPKKSFLRLPIHTHSLWTSRKPHLFLIANMQNCTVESILQTIHENIVACRIQRAETLDISVLSRFFELYESRETLEIFAKIAAFALEAEFLFTQPIEILARYSSASVVLNSLQIRSLLALMFFCVFPKQEPGFDLPRDYTFTRVFSDPGNRNLDSKLAKIKCSLNYFHRQSCCDPLNLEFSRRHLSRPPDWDSNSQNLYPVDLISEKNCTEDYRDHLMIDFANKYIGGGALGSGTVQEEIMFFKHMEPLVALLFTEKLEDRESIFITGVQRFNRTSGFKNSFEFIEDFKENIFLNENFQNNSVISVIDALDFSNRTQEQFGLKMIIRELDKAFAGFFYEKKNEIESVATGRWGCGAFSGDDELKFVIQWLAASASKKKMTYLLWDFPCPEKAQQFLEELCGKASVAQVFRCLKMLNGRESVFKQVLKNFNKIYR